MPKPAQAQEASNTIAFLIVTSVFMLSIVGAFMIYTQNINFRNAQSTVTVTGSSRSYERNRIATFNATATVSDADKDVAVQNMNVIAQGVIDRMLELGLDEKDIKTSNFSVFRDQYWDPNTQDTVERDWRASSTVEIRLQMADRATEISQVLSSMEGVEVFGPSFVTDNDLVNESQLLTIALADARTKAEKIAEATGRK